MNSFDISLEVGDYVIINNNDSRSVGKITKKSTNVTDSRYSIALKYPKQYRDLQIEVKKNSQYILIKLGKNPFFKQLFD